MYIGIQACFNFMIVLIGKRTTTPPLSRDNASQAKLQRVEGPMILTAQQV